MSTKELASNDDDVGYRNPPRSTQFAKGRSGNPRGRPPGAKNTATLLREAFEEKIMIPVNGRPRSFTKQEMALRQLANGAAKGDPKALALVMKYSQTMSEAEPEKTGDPDTAPKRRYLVILGDNQREPELTERLLKARQETRERYYASLRAQEAQHKDNLCSDIAQKSCADPGEESLNNHAPQLKLVSLAEPNL